MSELLTQSLSLSWATLRKWFRLFLSRMSFFQSLPRPHDLRQVSSWNADWLINWGICFPAQLLLHLSSSVQCLLYCTHSTNLSVHLTLQSPITCQKDPKILKLLCLGQQPDTTRRDHSAVFGREPWPQIWKSWYPGRFTLGWKPLQCVLKVMDWCSNTGHFPQPGCTTRSCQYHSILSHWCPKSQTWSETRPTEDFFCERNQTVWALDGGWNSSKN